MDGDAELGGESCGVRPVGMFSGRVLHGGDEQASGEPVCALLVAGVVACGVAVVGVPQLVRERAQCFGCLLYTSDAADE